MCRIFAANVVLLGRDLLTGCSASLFKFFDGTLNERVASSPAIANANEVQSDLASLLPQNSHQNTEDRKRRAGDKSSGNPEH